MKKNLKILAIIFSVVLNIVFTGSYFYHGSGLLPLVGRQANHDHPLYEELDLGRDQLDRFEPLRDSFHAFVNEQGRKIKAKQLELVGLLAKEKPDRRAIDAKQEEIQVLQRQMQAKVIDHLLEESRIFTPEQRQKFFALIKGRIEKSDGPRPRWMPRTQVSPSKGKRP
ncbi:MAG: periplasmic heavy metal sensor [Deltaproteobacteria bacterium]|nr:periplasmic heavy metal sensor [Deltaproteobacteria bacterium]